MNSLDQVKALAIGMAIKFGQELLLAMGISAAGCFVARWPGGMVRRPLLKLKSPVRSLLR